MTGTTPRPPELDSVFKAFLEAEARPDQVRAEILPAPHAPRGLPSGWQGVYSFRYAGTWLKVGRAGPNSTARWVSQHYNAGSAMSSLAWSLIRYSRFAGTVDTRLPESFRTLLEGVHPDDVGAWIKRNTDRCNILIVATLGRDSLALLQRIAIDVLKPVSEGRWAFGGTLPS